MGARQRRRCPRSGLSQPCPQTATAGGRPRAGDRPSAPESRQSRAREECHASFWEVAIVSGAGSGIGAAIARLFAGEGASLLVGDIYREGRQETARLIEADGGQAQFIETDVTGEADWAQLVAAAEER